MYVKIHKTFAIYNLGKFLNFPYSNFVRLPLSIYCGILIDSGSIVNFKIFVSSQVTGVLDLIHTRLCSDYLKLVTCVRDQLVTCVRDQLANIEIV